MQLKYTGMDTPVTITNPTYTIGKATLPLVAGTNFQVGQVVSFNATFQKGALTINTRGPGRKPEGVAWEGQAWTVKESDLTVDAIRYEHRANKQTLSELVIPIKVTAAATQPPVSPPPKPPEAQTGSISGYVFNDADADGIFDHPGEDGASREVTLVQNKAKVMSDATGLYSFKGLPAGTYDITREFPKGYKISNPTSKDGKSITVTLAAGENKEGVNIGSTYISPPTKPPVVDDNDPTPPPINDGGNNLKPKKAVCSIFSIAPDFKVDTNKGKVAWSDLVQAWKIQLSREWKSTSFNEGVSSKEFDTARLWKPFGITPTICFHLGGNPIPKSSQVRDYFKRVVDAANGLPFEAEIVNEPNLTSYYNGTIPQLVDEIVNPAYEVLHAAGVKVISPSVTGSTEWLERLFKAGVQCDYAGFHPYRTKASDAIAIHKKVVSIVGGKPIYYTEWNAGLGPNYRLYKDPTNKRKTSAQGTLFRTPAMNEDQILKILHDSWDGISKDGELYAGAYFIANSRGWKHTTGPINLLDDTSDANGKLASLRTTRFGEEFYATI